MASAARGYTDIGSITFAGWRYLFLGWYLRNCFWYCCYLSLWGGTRLERLLALATSLTARKAFGWVDAKVLGLVGGELFHYVVGGPLWFVDRGHFSDIEGLCLGDINW